MGSLIPGAYIHNIFYILSQSNHTVYLWSDRPVENRIKFLDEVGGYSLFSHRNKSAIERLQFKQIFQLEVWSRQHLNLSNIQARMLSECFLLEYPKYSSHYMGSYDLAVIKTLGNLATLSDILRLIIIYKEGGIYIDCDNTFRGQAIYKESILPTKIQKHKFNIQISNKTSLYSHQERAGNSVLACYSGAQGCLELLKASLDIISRQKTGRIYIDNIDKAKNWVFTKESYLKKCYEYLMSNDYIEKDGDLRRHGKDPNGYKLQTLKENGGVSPMAYHYGYPYAFLAMEIGPESLKQFKVNNTYYHKNIFDLNIYDHIIINSDKTWL
jgi:hypothetical protein